MSRLSESTKAGYRDALLELNSATRKVAELTANARSAGEISEEGKHAVLALTAEIATCLAMLAAGYIQHFAKPQERDVTVPVPDSELPDLNYVTTDAPNN